MRGWLWLVLVMTRLDLVVHHRGSILCCWSRHAIKLVLLLQLSVRGRMAVVCVVFFSWFKLTSKFRCFFLFSFILLDGSIKGLLDSLPPGCKIDMTQLGQFASPTGSSGLTVVSDLSLDAGYSFHDFGS